MKTPGLTIPNKHSADFYKNRFHLNKKEINDLKKIGPSKHQETQIALLLKKTLR